MDQIASLFWCGPIVFVFGNASFISCFGSDTIWRDSHMTQFIIQMSECIVKSDGTKGSIDFYDPITNRYFIHCGDAYSWQDPWNLTFEKDFKSPET